MLQSTANEQKLKEENDKLRALLAWGSDPCIWKGMPMDTGFSLIMWEWWFISLSKRPEVIMDWNDSGEMPLLFVWMKRNLTAVRERKQRKPYDIYRWMKRIVSAESQRTKRKTNEIEKRV